MAATPFHRHKTASLALCWVLADLMAPSLTDAQIIDTSSVVIPPLDARPSNQRSAFTRDGDIAVLDRVVPAFSAQGVPVGGLDLFPGLTIAGVGISNVFANNANRKSDLEAIVSPEATLRTRGGPVDLSITGKAVVTRLRKYHSENTEQGSVGFTVDAEVGPLSRLFSGASYGWQVLPRYASDSPVDAAKPLEYKELKAFAGGAFETGRTRLTARVDDTRLRFDDNTPRVGGGLITADDRDRNIMSGTVKIERALKPNMSFYVAGTGNWINYKLEPPRVPTQRDSTGWGAYVGSNFELTRLMRADVRIGYIRQNFDTPGVRPISGLGLKGKVQYFPTRLTTVTLEGERSVQDSGVPGTSGYVHTGGQIEADHELRRYVVLTALAGHFRDRYKGQFRTENNTYAGVSGTYLSAHHWNARVGYQYNRRQCRCTINDASFDDHRLMASLTFQY